MKCIKSNFKKLTVDNVINIIGQFLTLLSLLFVFLTLKEMQIQRDRAYMPQIVADCKDNIELKWTNQSDFVYLNSDDQDFVQTYLDIYNIGVGIAKNIEFEWGDSNLSDLNEIINNNTKDISVNLINQKLFVKSSMKEFGGLELEKKDTLNFLASSSEKSYKLKIPYAYLVCYKIMLIEQIKDIPPLSLNISYKDIQGKSYKQSIHITPQIIMLLSESGSRYEDFQGQATLNFATY